MEKKAKAVVEFAYEQLLDIYIQNNRSASAVSSWIYDELKEFDLSTKKKDEINTKEIEISVEDDC